MAYEKGAKGSDLLKTGVSVTKNRRKIIDFLPACGSELWEEERGKPLVFEL